MHLGLVTYNLARDWDLPTLIKNCEETGFEAVELRTTHAHGVEPELDSAGRERVRSLFAQTPVKLLSFGTTCEFHSRDAEEVKSHIRRCAEFVELAHDLGATGVKVRPNGFPEGVPIPDTLKQIGEALRECGEHAAGYGVQIWLEVHGRGTQEVPHIRTILDHANHPNVFANWNSNQTDKDANGSIEASFRLLEREIGSVHITDLYRTDYPYRELFRLLEAGGYPAYCLAELPNPSADPLYVMRYYRALFDELGRP